MLPSLLFALQVSVCSPISLNMMQTQSPYLYDYWYNRFAPLHISHQVKGWYSIPMLRLRLCHTCSVSASVSIRPWHTKHGLLLYVAVGWTSWSIPPFCTACYLPVCKDRTTLYVCGWILGEHVVSSPSTSHGCITSLCFVCEGLTDTEPVRNSLTTIIGHPRRRRWLDVGS